MIDTDINFYDRQIIALYNQSYGKEQTDMMRGGDTYQKLGWRLKPSKWNWLLTLIGMERYEEVGVWYWADGLEHEDTTFLGFLKRSKPLPENDTWVWNVNGAFLPKHIH